MNDFAQNHLWLFLVVVFWSVPWKGVALWRAAKNNQIFWFIALFIFNTVAILDIIYLFFFSRPVEDNEDKFEIEDSPSDKETQRRRVII